MKWAGWGDGRRLVFSASATFLGTAEAIVAGEDVLSPEVLVVLIVRPGTIVTDYV